MPWIWKAYIPVVLVFIFILFLISTMLFMVFTMMKPFGLIVNCIVTGSVAVFFIGKLIHLVWVVFFAPSINHTYSCCKDLEPITVNWQKDGF